MGDIKHQLLKIIHIFPIGEISEDPPPGTIGIVISQRRLIEIFDLEMANNCGYILDIAHNIT